MHAFFALALLSLTSPSADATATDARLNDVCFVDAQNGWAVGDRGTIVATTDGGNTWQRQSSAATCTLRSVWFLNQQFGWAAGGFTHPYTHTSTGIILATTDGGQTWAETPNLGLPALRRVRFFDARRAWAIGCPSAMYPTGVFSTDDGGRHWLPVPGHAQPGGWTAGDFLDPHTGALAGRNGATSAIHAGQIDPARAERFDLRSLTQMQFSPSGDGWLVGDGGLVLCCNKRDIAWQPPPGTLPPHTGELDLSALAVHGRNCWIAGTPGTCVFHSPDAGRTWHTFATGSTVPLRAMTFVDDQHGWAVGELGLILATADGGRSWQRQRSGGQQAAMLALLAEPDDVPLEMIAQAGEANGYRIVINVLGRRDIENPPRDNVPLNDRLHEAVVGVGGVGAEAAWQFPLRQSGLRLSEEKILDAWDRMNQGQGAGRLQAYLVRQIRMWRPEVLLTHDLPKGGRFDDPQNAPLHCLIHQAVLEAVAQAADPRACPEQIAAAGLQPWTVKRVFAALPRGARGSIDLTTEQYSVQLGRTPAEVAAEPRGLLDDRFTPSPQSLGFQVLQTVEEFPAQRDFFAGIALEPGGPARRTLAPLPSEIVDLRKRIAQKRRHVLAILDRAGSSAASVEALLAQIDELTADLDDQSRGQILFQLADRFCHTGRWPLAAETFQLLADRYPQHGLAPPSLLWELQYYASAEAAWRAERGGDPAKRFQQAVAVGSQIERIQPQLFAEPRLCLPLAAAYRGLGDTRRAEQLQSYHPTDDRPTIVCPASPAKPHLDGLLDDPVWKQTKPIALQSAQHDDGPWPAEVMLAHDDEFLYLAARCRIPDAEETPPNDPSTARPRDADLSSEDRIEVFLDIDRDFSTFYRLAIDRRGWTNDSCWNDATWDPAWFVATAQDRGIWTAEAAIPWVELVAASPPPDATWAVGLQRTIPTVGFQSWSTPAAVSVQPEGFGLMIFR